MGKTKSRDASMRPRPNSSINVDDQKPKIISKLNSKDLIFEHKNKSGNYNQSDIKKSNKIEEEKKLEFSDESSSMSSGRDIHGEGDNSDSDF